MRRGYKRAYAKRVFSKSRDKKVQKVREVPPYDLMRLSYNPKDLSPLPSALKVKMKYHEAFTLNVAAAGLADSYIFSANGLYDPNITGIGHQPRGFDQLMTMYDHYVVIGVRAHLFMSNVNTLANNQSICTMLLSDGTALINGNNGAFESRVSISKAQTLADGGLAINELILDANPNEFLGRSKPLSDPDLKGNASSNPAEQAYIHVIAHPFRFGEDIGAVDFHIILEYTAILIEPNLPAAS